MHLNAMAYTEGNSGEQAHLSRRIGAKNAANSIAKRWTNGVIGLTEQRSCEQVVERGRTGGENGGLDVCRQTR